MDRGTRRANKRRLEISTEAEPVTGRDADSGPIGETPAEQRAAVPVAAKARRIDFSGNITLKQALAAFVQGCVEHGLANAECVLKSDEPRGIPEKRVALRLLRSASRVSSAILLPDRRKQPFVSARFLANDLAAAQCRHASGIVVGWRSHALAALEQTFNKSVNCFMKRETFWRNWSTMPS